MLCTVDCHEHTISRHERKGVVYVFDINTTRHGLYKDSGPAMHPQTVSYTL